MLAIQTAGVIPYLGIDLVFKANGSNRQQLAKRLLDFGARCHLIRCLPPVSRPRAVSDAVSALWLAAGTTLSPSQYGDLTSQAAAALRGRTFGGATNLRSCTVEHLIGPAAHRTHPLMAGLYCWVLQVDRMRAYISDAQWADLWSVKDCCRIGPMTALAVRPH